MDEKLIATVNKIKLLAEQNQEFNQTMQKLFGNTVSASVVNINSTITEDISAIRSALEIRAKESLKYSFVRKQRLRDQLIIDNLRMENAALNLKEPEADRFYVFCVNAFYQVENILNYFYYTSFPEIDALLKEIEDGTQNEKNDFKFRRTGKEQNVGSIPVAHKLNAFFNTYLPEEGFLKWSIGTLRQVRNEGEHRCDIIRQEKDDNNNLYKFFKSKTFNYVRIDLIKFVNAIEHKLENPDKKEMLESIIKSKLPSVCYVLLRGNSVLLPNKLFAKVRHLNNNDEIILTVSGNTIIDVAAK
ncbi:hypothetical protein [Prevotella corporis]|uniref:Uncharacterized protein n=1 Tax=Prevotella corporis TaxID=28128 RepID=A0A133QGL1_9BACT|nr:hypothetical protein [Prevotella corporis]KXA42008.1 hypothetical protein HMPREF3226_00770 [Prevotella corporis]